MAHEVRNPLAAAMAATTFLRTELDRKQTGKNGIRKHFDDDSDIESDTDADAEEDGNTDNNGEEQKEEYVEKEDLERDASIKTLSSPRLVQAREDVRVVDHALRFINELLRNMLDMHRASSGKLQVKLAPVDLLHDVLEPVAGMLHRGGEGRVGRGNGDEKVQITVECPKDIVVETDVLRLKQVILNLGRNSVKFI